MLVRRIKSVLKGVDRLEVAMACAAVVVEALAQMDHERSDEARNKILEALVQDWTDHNGSIEH